MDVEQAGNAAADELDREIRLRLLPVERTRVLTTVLFTDIVESCALASAVGDARWRELLVQHHAAVRGELARFAGRELDTAGDGFFACFETPSAAILCADGIVAKVSALGVDVRAGVHAGECDIFESKLSGTAIHVGARVLAAAGPGEILVTGTVRELVAGSLTGFEERGQARLRGVPGEWQLYAFRGPARTSRTPRRRVVSSVAARELSSETSGARSGVVCARSMRAGSAPSSRARS